MMDNDEEKFATLLEEGNATLSEQETLVVTGNVSGTQKGRKYE